MVIEFLPEQLVSRSAGAAYDMPVAGVGSRATQAIAALRARRHRHMSPNRANSMLRSSGQAVLSTDNGKMHFGAHHSPSTIMTPAALRRIFRYLDKDHHGVLTREAFFEGLEALGLLSHEHDRAKAMAVLLEIDTDESGDVSGKCLYLPCRVNAGIFCKHSCIFQRLSLSPIFKGAHSKN